MASLDMFQKGGPIMYVLALLSVYALGVVIYKAFQFWRLRIFDDAFADEVMQYVRAADTQAAMHRLNRESGPLSRVMQTALYSVLDASLNHDKKVAEITRVASIELRHIESHMRGLEMAANIGPLLGLLGTVTGMVQTFAQLEAAGARIDPSMLAGGIWEALVTTAAGLVVAIPALAAHYILDGLIDRLRGNMKDYAVQILSLEAELRAYQEVGEAERRRQILAGELQTLAQQREQLKNAQEEEAKRLEAIRNQEIAGNISTLRMLNPRYGS